MSSFLSFVLEETGNSASGSSFPLLYMFRMRQILEAAALLLLTSSHAETNFSSMFKLMSRALKCGPELCHAQPSTCPNAVPGLSTTRPASYQNYSLTFLNTASQGIVLSWLEGNGTVRPMVVLAPGERREIATQTGDMCVSPAQLTPTQRSCGPMCAVQMASTRKRESHMG